MANHRDLGLVLRSLLWTALVPGTVTLYLPYLIVTRWYPVALLPWHPYRLLGIPMILTGAVILFYCIWLFALTGRGTLSPLDAPSRLVVQGLYRYVRNPMYLGVMLILTGESLAYQSLPLVVYAFAWFVLFNLVVVFYEEPGLRERFGRAYESYCSRVGRWWPGK